MVVFLPSTPVCSKLTAFSMYKRLRKIAKSDYQFGHVSPSVRVCTSAWKVSASTGRIFLKSVERRQVV